MGANLCKPSCMHTNQGTIIKISSNCFTKPVKIYIGDDDTGLEQLNALLTQIRDRKLSRSASVNK